MGKRIFLKSYYLFVVKCTFIYILEKRMTTFVIEFWFDDAFEALSIKRESSENLELFPQL